jgi:hypothetical protein
VLSLGYLRRYPSAGLLLVQLGGILLYPLMEASPRGRALFGAFGLLVLGVALWVVRRGPWLTWIASVIALPVVVLALVQAIAPMPGLMVATAALESAFYFYATGSLIAYMLQDTVATTDEMFAAGATFTLLAWAFAYLYVVCQAVFPGSFLTPLETIEPQGSRSWMQLLYMSFIVLSGVGLSDVVAATPMARALVMLEAFGGVMYIALVVSRLVGLVTFARRGRMQQR